MRSAASEESPKNGPLARHGSAPARQAATDHPMTTAGALPESPRAKESVATPANAARVSGPAAAQRRTPAADVRRTVWQRDNGQCAYADSRGQRCRERSGLEFTIENLTPATGRPISKTSSSAVARTIRWRPNTISAANESESYAGALPKARELCPRRPSRAGAAPSGRARDFSRPRRRAPTPRCRSYPSSTSPAARAAPSPDPGRTADVPGSWE